MIVKVDGMSRVSPRKLCHTSEISDEVDKGGFIGLGSKDFIIKADRALLVHPRSGDTFNVLEYFNKTMEKDCNMKVKIGDKFKVVESESGTPRLGRVLSVTGRYKRGYDFVFGIWGANVVGGKLVMQDVGVVLEPLKEEVEKSLEVSVVGNCTHIKLTGDFTPEDLAELGNIINPNSEFEGEEEQVSSAHPQNNRKKGMGININEDGIIEGFWCNTRDLDPRLEGGDVVICEAGMYDDFSVGEGYEVLEDSKGTFILGGASGDRRIAISSCLGGKYAMTTGFCFKVIGKGEGL